MTFSPAPLEFNRIMVSVAIEVMGEPNRALSTKQELRWNGRGSFCVNVKKGVWTDHESGTGGGVLDLLRLRKGLAKSEALQYLRDRKHIAPAEDLMSEKRIVATYDYVNDDGDLIVQVVRFDPKDFRQRRREGGSWAWKGPAGNPVLYRLSETRAAIRAGMTIYVAEGEKAVEALTGLGVAATCGLGGAGKWRPHYSDVLADADVVLLPDNDEAGRQHSTSVAHSLSEKARRVRVLALPDLPEKGDCSDWIDAGGTVDQLDALTYDAPEAEAQAASGASRTKWQDNSDTSAENLATARSAYHGLRDLLDKDGNGAVRPTHANLILICKQDPLLNAVVRHDSFTGRIMIMRPVPVISTLVAPAAGPYPRQLDDGDVTRTVAYLQKEWSHAFKRGTVDECLHVDAHDRSFHPVVDWLASLEWDRKPRIEQWLTKVFGCELDPYHRAVGSKLLIAAVRRVRQPGCKFDYLPVLSGRQGIGKSRALALLFRREWCTDDLPDDLSDKDAAIALAGAWCVELAEISQLLRSEAETVKAFLSRAIDRYRPPYGRGVVEMPRQCVLVGTTNSTEYLRDPTGNRRIWPIQCHSAGRADIEWLTANRDQLWAEAAYNEKADASIWLDDGQVEATANAAQAELMTGDLWSDQVLSWVSGKASVAVPDVLEHALLIALSHQDRRAEMRVAAILLAAGWSKKQVWDSEAKMNRKRWIAPEAE